MLLILFFPSDGTISLRTVSAKTRKSKMILGNLFKTNEDCSSHDAVLERIHLVCYYITTVLDKVFIPRKFKKELVYCNIDHVSCKVHEPS